MPDHDSYVACCSMDLSVGEGQLICLITIHMWPVVQCKWLLELLTVSILLRAR